MREGDLVSVPLRGYRIPNYTMILTHLKILAESFRPLTGL